MITITNVTDPLVSNAQLNTYKLAINGSVITTFDHYPINGLAVCLLKAFNAVVAVDQLECQSRFPNEKNPPCPEVPDEKDGLSCEEILRAEADEAEASLEEKDYLVSAVSSLEGEPGHKAVMLALWLGDRDREQRELASSLRAENASNLVVCDPGVRPLP